LNADLAAAIVPIASPDAIAQAVAEERRRCVEVVRVPT
jgi:hypothetical protein